MSTLRSSSGNAHALPDGDFDRNIPRPTGPQTTSRRWAIDLVVNVRGAGVGTALAVPLLFAPVPGITLSGAAVVVLLSALNGSYLRLSTVTRR
ncbi:hypothetical protein ACIRRH_35545 [Kitasatospora sp. NPDC101235]|uniref:hypothetical protein n=1 Tax=Kitasatospora sp. NPDC101235 TaxID=3364101 RepID=UPI00382212A5